MRIKRFLFVLVFFLSVNLSSTVSASAENKIINIGLFKSTGMEGIKESLSEINEFRVAEITRLDKDTLFQFDVIILGSVKGFPVPLREWGDALELYVRCGGGVLLHHDATGFRSEAFWGGGLFPGFFKGKSKIDDTAVFIADKTHEVTIDIPVEFNHDYFDHIQLHAGSSGKILVKDAKGEAVVVCGQMENGRVIGNGMLTGYADAERAGFEKAPEGGERKLLLNSINWLAEVRLTKMSREKLTERAGRIAGEMHLKAAADVSREAALITSSGSYGEDWYCDSMLNESAYIHPPVNMLGGRFFLFDGHMYGIAQRGRSRGDGRDYEEIVSILRQLKWLGVTDIIAMTGGPLRVMYLSEVPDTTFRYWAKNYGFDYLEVMLRACHEAGLDVWAFWHPNEDERNIKKPEYYIRDIQGKVLVPYADIMSPEFNKLARSMIDELAGRYNKYGNLKGIFLDEFWHGLGRDPLVNYLDRYVQYCKGNYNETPPENIYGLIAGGRNWHDPDNIWWRRYILWKNTLIVDWVRNITDYANSKGLLIMNQPVFTAEFSDGWNWGHGDMYNLAREGNLLWAYETRNSKLLNHYPKERIVLGTHTHNRWNRQSISLITGKGGSQFVFGAMWIPIAQAMNPEILNLVARQIRSNREWYGAEHLSGTAILNNGLILELKTQNPKTVFTRTHLSLQKKLQASFDTGMLLIDNIEFYDRYKVLIAPPHTVSCLPMRTVNGLKKYVENGGIIISLNSRFSSARADLTDEKDLTPEFTGIEYEDKKSMDIVETVRFTDGGYQDIKLNTFLTTRARIVNPEVKIRAVFAETDEPAITELNIGKGKIIAYHYDAIDAVSMSESDTLDYLLTQIERYSAPGVRVEGDLQIHYTLKKNNWVVTTLLGNEEKGYPMSGNLYIDTERLGLDFKNNKYKVYSLSRDRELQPQGIHWTLWGRHWTSEMLKEGIDIYIPPNSLVDLKLPSGPDDVYAADRYVQSAVLPRWYTRNYTRSYEYEIIAIAPVGESYPGEDKHETDGN